MDTDNDFIEVCQSVYDRLKNAGASPAELQAVANISYNDNYLHTFFRGFADRSVLLGEDNV